MATLGGGGGGDGGGGTTSSEKPKPDKAALSAVEASLMRPSTASACVADLELATSVTCSTITATLLHAGLDTYDRKQ